VIGALRLLRSNSFGAASWQIESGSAVNARQAIRFNLGISSTGIIRQVERQK
jgi:hypothetical protein